VVSHSSISAGNQTRTPDAGFGSGCSRFGGQQRDRSVSGDGALPRSRGVMKNRPDIHEITFDRRGARKLSVDLTDSGFKMIQFGQGYSSMSPPTKELLNLVLSKKIRHGGNPVLRWMADSMEVKQNSAGNIKPSKPDRGKSGKRNDGIVALIMAVDRVTRNESHSAWSESGHIFI